MIAKKIAGQKEDPVNKYFPIGKEHSFFEPNDKSKIAEKDNAIQHFDYDRLARAISYALTNQQNGNDPKEIIIHDRTANGITSEHMENMGRNANSIFGGGH